MKVTIHWIGTSLLSLAALLISSQASAQNCDAYRNNAKKLKACQQRVARMGELAQQYGNRWRPVETAVKGNRPSRGQTQRVDLAEKQTALQARLQDHQVKTAPSALRLQAQQKAKNGGTPKAAQPALTVEWTCYPQSVYEVGKCLKHARDAKKSFDVVSFAAQVRSSAMGVREPLRLALENSVNSKNLVESSLAVRALGALADNSSFAVVYQLAAQYNGTVNVPAKKSGIEFRPVDRRQALALEAVGRIAGRSQSNTVITGVLLERSARANRDNRLLFEASVKGMGELGTVDSATRLTSLVGPSSSASTTQVVARAVARTSSLMSDEVYQSGRGAVLQQIVDKQFIPNLDQGLAIVAAASGLGKRGISEIIGVLEGAYSGVYPIERPLVENLANREMKHLAANAYRDDANSDSAQRLNYFAQMAKLILAAPSREEKRNLSIALGHIVPASDQVQILEGAFALAQTEALASIVAGRSMEKFAVETLGYSYAKDFATRAHQLDREATANGRDAFVNYLSGELSGNLGNQSIAPGSALDERFQLVDLAGSSQTRVATLRSSLKSANEISDANLDSWLTVANYIVSNPHKDAAAVKIAQEIWDAGLKIHSDEDRQTIINELRSNADFDRLVRSLQGK